jgi:hypothetical protein
MEQTSYYGAPGREVRFAADSPVEGDGFELPVPPGIGGSPSWWSRTRKPHGAPELGFIDGGTNSSNPPPSTGESANFWFLAAEPSWCLSKPLEPPAVIPATRPASMGYRPCAARQQSLDHGHGSSVTAAASGPAIAVRPPAQPKRNGPSRITADDLGGTKIESPFPL